ncbi:hypothetical protein EP7_001640 [Isosphaeraceae bacterium EP7]
MGTRRGGNGSKLGCGSREEGARMRWTAGLLGLVLTSAPDALATAAGNDELPPLTAPADLPAPAEATALPELPPAPAQAEPDPSSSRSLPGLPLYPGPRRPPTRRSPTLQARAASSAELPALDGPAEMTEGTSSTPAPKADTAPFTIQPGRGANLPPGSSRRPLIIESEVGGPTSELDDLDRIPPPRGGRNLAPIPPVERRSRFFGMVPPAMTNTPKSIEDPAPNEPDLDSDPAADAALKRRIEKTAKEVVGTKVRTIDVSVIGHKITIRAHGTRLLQRRAVRRTLEGLPPIAGYRTQIEVN